MKELLITGTWALKDHFSNQKDRKISIKARSRAVLQKCPHVTGNLLLPKLGEKKNAFYYNKLNVISAHKISWVGTFKFFQIFLR